MASGVRKFKFISPGVFINEIDRSQLPRIPTATGPVIIGRTKQGPGLRPIQVSSFEEFVRVFGSPDPGSDGNDNWRDNNFDGPTYAGYAAQAWLASGQAPVTMIRLLGSQHVNFSNAGRAGWDLEGTPSPTKSENAGAYGLFLINSSSVRETGAGGDGAPQLFSQVGQTGSLAAVFYVTKGNYITLSGNIALNRLGGDPAVAEAARQIADQPTGSNTVASLLRTTGDSYEFMAMIRNEDDVVQEQITFNFNKNSDRYIRKVFNTNPSQTNTDVVASASAKTYWLGETYDQFINSDSADHTLSELGDGGTYGAILALYNTTGSTLDWDDHRTGFQDAETPYVYSQDLGVASNFDLIEKQKLFKFVSRGYGEWANNNIKVSVENIRAADYPEIDPYGTFSVTLRHVRDTDNAPIFLERFDLCNLNPNSENYIAKKVGDRFIQWDDSDRRYREYGEYANKSDYVRVVVHENVAAAGAEAELLPFGYFGPPRYNGFSFRQQSGSVTGPLPLGFTSYDADDTRSIVQGGSQLPGYLAGDGDAAAGGNTFLLANPISASYSGSFVFPKIRTRVSASEGAISNPTDAYFGVQTTTTKDSLRFDESYYDLVRPLTPIGSISSFGTSDFADWSFVFTLDDLVSGSGGGQGFFHSSGSRQAGTSFTATGANTYKTLLDQGYDRFTLPMHGGFDGLNIKEKEPFRNTFLDSGNELTNYGINSVKRAIDTVRDPEVVETNLMTAPGIWVPALTDHLRSVCEDRGDALAIIDIQHGYNPATEGNAYLTPTQQAPDVAQAVSTLRDRAINSSYACTFFPWVQIRDTLSGRLLPVPPSVAALGTFGTSQARTELWFAPAGFVRGGLSNGAAGIPVTGVKMRLTSKNRDDLYSANINPIATFPNEGIVVFGQKTLQITPSALDRINVRRLMIFVKKEVSRIANSILFEPNVQATWDRFTGAVEPFLADVKARFGLTDFRVVLDSSTTTDDLVDRNILYAKIFLKPARAIEFIALDFIITRTGASFDD
jgi:hypothetical protein